MRVYAAHLGSGLAQHGSCQDIAQRSEATLPFRYPVYLGVLQNMAYRPRQKGLLLERQEGSSGCVLRSCGKQSLSCSLVAAVGPQVPAGLH